MKNGKIGFLVKITAAAVALVVSLTAFAACGQTGEKLAYGKEIVTLSTQLDTLTQLNAGSLDAAVIDSVMAGYYSSNGEYAGKVTVMDGVLKREQYGIAARKSDEALMSEINKALLALAGNGGMEEVAKQFGLTSDIAVTGSETNPYEDATDSSWEKIKQSGKIVIGYTVFAPIAFDEGDGLTGYDIELARAVVEWLNQTYSLDLELEFQIIDWNSKEVLLSNGTIDLIWNGMTIHEEMYDNLEISNPYLTNNQAMVVKSDSNITKEQIKSQKLKIAVENGSAGADAAEENFPESQVVKVTDQISALTELKAGNVQVAIIDSIMAGYYAANDESSFKGQIKMITKADGSLDALTTEEYGIAAKKGNVGLIAMVNDTLAKLYQNGTMTEIAEKYGFEKIIVKESFENYVTQYDKLSEAEKASWEVIKEKGKIRVGYTLFAPIAY